MASSPPRRPPYDPAFASLIQVYEQPDDSDVQKAVDAARQWVDTFRAPLIEALRADPELLFTDSAIPGPRGEIPITVIKKTPQGNTTASAPRPGLFFIHGGGLTLGDRYMGVEPNLIKALDLVLVTPDYRLAPEHPGPAPVEDCYAALRWTGDHLPELGIDPERLLIGGTSAGACLAVGTTLMVRDKGGPKLRAQHLMCAMLDDRNNHVSTKQYWADGLYTGSQNGFQWSMVLGDKAGSDDVSPYIVPGRATDLSNIPEAYLDVGSAEPFRDEVVAFASKLWECGIQAELHVWPGGPHGFRTWMPTAALSMESAASALNWFKRMLA